MSCLKPLNTVEFERLQAFMVLHARDRLQITTRCWKKIFPRLHVYSTISHYKNATKIWKAIEQLRTPFINGPSVPAFEPGSSWCGCCRGSFTSYFQLPGGLTGRKSKNKIHPPQLKRAARGWLSGLSYDGCNRHVYQNRSLYVLVRTSIEPLYAR